jgi:hypothetical protein
VRRVCLSVFAVGCAAALPEVPSKGGPPWRELTTEHFTLWTDATAERGRDLVDEMEHVRSVVYGVAFPDLAVGGRTFAVAFRNQRESGNFTPPDHPAVTYSGTTMELRQPLMVFYADAHHDDQLVAHELTHAVSYSAVHDQPRWFAEGLATYFENLTLDLAHDTVEVGRPPENYVRALEHQPLLPIAQLFACESIACTDTRFYLTAWSLFTYVHNKRPADLARLEQLMNGPTANAWRAVFSEPPEQLDRELAEFLTHGGNTIYSFKLSVRTWPVTERPLGDADVLAMRGLLHWAKRHDDPAAGNEVASALALEPTNVLARVLDVTLHHDLAVADARATAAAHPDSWQAWALLADRTRDAERVDALAKACALMAKNPAIAQQPACR